MRTTLAAAALMLSAFAASAAEINGPARVVDGDTIEIAATKIRLSGVDSPETDQLCLDAKGGRWACGVSARDELVRHVGDSRGPAASPERIATVARSRAAPLIARTFKNGWCGTDGHSHLFATRTPTIRTRPRPAKRPGIRNVWRARTPRKRSMN